MRRVLVAACAALFVGLFTFGFGQGDQSRVPPKEGCTHEMGRTVCEALESGEIETVYEIPLGPCDGPDLGLIMDGTFFRTGELLVRMNEVEVITYFGDSHMVERSRVIEEELEAVEAVPKDIRYYAG